MVRHRSPSNSPRSPMRRRLLRMSPTMLPRRRHTVRRIMAMVHIIRQRRANQPSHRIKSSPPLHHRNLKPRPTSRISHHTTNQSLATAQASHTTTCHSPSNSPANPLSSCQRQQLTHPAHKLTQTRHSMRAPTQAPASPLRSPTSHNRAATMARHMPTHSNHSAPLPWLLPAQKTLVQQANQTPPSR